MDSIVDRDVISVETVTHYSNSGENYYWCYHCGPEGYKLVRQELFQEEGIHIHVGYFRIIPPPPLPSIEEAAIAHIKKHGRGGNATYSVLFSAVQRKLDADG